jgi:hypothetical protein
MCDPNKQSPDGIHIGTLPTDENNIIASAGITRNITSMFITPEFASFSLPLL